MPTSDIQDYFECFIKKHETLTDNTSIKKYISRIENRITLKVKTRCYLGLLTSETMKLFGSTGKKIVKYKTSENLPNLQIIKVTLIHCNVINNDYKQDSRFSVYTFVLRSFG